MYLRIYVLLTICPTAGDLTLGSIKGARQSPNVYMSISILIDMTFETLTQASGATGLSKEILRAAKSHGCPGFVAHRLRWDLAEPWIKEHEQELEEWASQSTEEIKRQNLIKDGLLKDLEISKRKQEMLDPKEVAEFLKSFGLSLSSLLKTKEKDLRSKCSGYDATITKEFSELYALIQREIAEWK